MGILLVGEGAGGVVKVGKGVAVGEGSGEGVGVGEVVGVGVGEGIGVGEVVGVGVGEGIGVTVMVTVLEVAFVDVASPGQKTRICQVPGPELNPKSRVYTPLVIVSSV